jgi:hypothetical protein
VATTVATSFGEDLAHSVREAATREIVDNFDVDYADLASEVDVSEMVYELDLGDIAGELDHADIAENIDPSAVAEHIDYKLLAEELNPMEGLAAAAPKGASDVGGAVVEKAVDRLLLLACEYIESGKTTDGEE